MKNCVVYMISNIIDKKFYIGSSKYYEKRQYQHFYLLSNNKHPNRYLQNSYNKYGKECFLFSVLEYTSEEDIIIKEQFWIDTLKPIYNINPKAYSCKGRITTEETRKKLSVSAIARGSNVKGKKHTKQWYEKRCKDPIINIVTGEKFFGVKNAAESANLKTETLRTWLKYPNKNKSNFIYESKL